MPLRSNFLTKMSKIQTLNNIIGKQHNPDHAKDKWTYRLQDYTTHGRIVTQKQTTKLDTESHTSIRSRVIVENQQIDSLWRKIDQQVLR